MAISSSRRFSTICPRTANLADTEIFGPVLSLVHANDLDEAMAFLERSAYGNQASLFTSSGAAARRFRYEAPAGNIGINIGVAAPMAYFPFSGWKDSFFGVHARPGPRCHRVLHGEESRGGALGQRTLAQVLKSSTTRVHEGKPQFEFFDSVL